MKNSFKEITITVAVDHNSHTVKIEGELMRGLRDMLGERAIEETLNIVCAEVNTLVKNYLTESELL